MSQAIVRSASDKQKNIMSLIEARKGAIAAILPKHLTPERLMKVALSTTARNPLLLACTPGSLVLAVMQAAELGLEPGGLLGGAYLVPFRNKKGEYEAKLIVGYRGLVDLARRSGALSSIEAHVVRANEPFEVEYGLNTKLVHKPAIAGDPGDVIAAYMVARFKDGSHQVEIMTRKEIDDVRARSASKDDGPWVTDFPEMARKSVVRRGCKMLPMSPELQKAIANEDRVDSGDVAPVFDVDISMVDEPAEEPSRAETLASKINGAQPEAKSS